MGENNPEISLSNGMTITKISPNNSVFTDKKETEVAPKSLTEIISVPSSSKQQTGFKNKNPSRKHTKPNVKIISVVNIPNLIEEKIKAQKKNRHIPIILKKPQKPSFKANHQRTVANLAASFLASNIQNKPAVNYSPRETLKTADQSTQTQKIEEPSSSNALLVSKEFAFPLLNSSQMQNVNLNQVVPYPDNRQVVQQYFNMSNIPRHLNTNIPNHPAGVQLLNGCKEAEYYCGPMSLNPVQALSANRIFGTQIFQIPSNGHKSDNINNAKPIQNLKYWKNAGKETLNSIRRNVQPPKVKISRMVSILKNNQPNYAINSQTQNGVTIEEVVSDSPAEVESGIDVDSGFEAESGIQAESGIDAGSGIEAEAKAQAETETGVDAEIEYTLMKMEIGSNSLNEASAPGLSFLDDKLSTDKKMSTSYESDGSLVADEDFSLENYLSLDETFETESASEAEIETEAVSKKPGVFEPAPSTSKGKGIFEPEIGVASLKSAEVSTGTGDALHNMAENGIEANVPVADTVTPPREEINTKKSKGASSELATVTSDDIPYNGEIEIYNMNNNNNDNNNNGDSEDDVDDDDGKKHAGNKDATNPEKDDDAVDLDKWKGDLGECDSSKRKLFLEREDVEFCKEAQRRVKGIRRYGYRGLCAIGKFNHILNLIPDENPATIHALMVAYKNRVTPVLGQLHYIQKARKALLAQENQSSASSSSDSSASTSSTSSAVDTSENEAAEAKAERSIPNTRKKKISYNIDLSDNPDDSDEDYVPGQDVTPKKKKRCKRRGYSSGRPKKIFNDNESDPVQETPHLIQDISTPTEATSDQPLNNKENAEKTIEEEEKENDATCVASQASTSQDISGDSSNEPLPVASSSHSLEDKEEKQVVSSEKPENPHERKRIVIKLLKQSPDTYKAEPVPREVYELVKFKKKRTPNSHVVPPLQKFAYAHKGAENFRYMTISKD